jgi:prolyl-tRNA synthetase
MLDVYATFAEEYMAMPVHKGKKTEAERFPGAVDTYSIEAMMQDRKALQAGTSHFLGQNFAKASGIRFQTKNETEEHAWTTSWGVSTRLVGALVMTHADDDGLIIPPRLAPAHAVILPVLRGDDTKGKVMDYIASLVAELKAVTSHGRRIEVEVDNRDLRGGEKNWEWIKRGVPLRIEVGPRDVESGNLVVSRRDRGPKDKTVMSRVELVSGIASILEDMHQTLYGRASAHAKQHTRRIATRAEFEDFFTPKSTRAASSAGAEERPELHGGFAICHFSGDAAVEAELRDKLKVTVRNIPIDLRAEQYEGTGCESEEGTCIFTGKPARLRAIFAKAY